jgi:hypothetical protein
MKNEMLITDDLLLSKILQIRNQKVMIDRDLAEMYGVETRILNQAVKRNLKRFPEDFMFQMTAEELDNWKSQNVISNKEKMGLRKLPNVFTEQGVAMLSGVLNSDIAIEVNIRIMRVFTKLRESMLANKEILLKLEKLDRKLIGISHDVKMHDGDIETIFELIKEIMDEKMRPRPRNPIGFQTQAVQK